MSLRKWYCRWMTVYLHLGISCSLDCSQLAMTNNETCNGADHEVVRSQKNTVIETVSHLSKHDKRIQFCFDKILPHKPWTSKPRTSAYNPFCDPSWFSFEVFESYTSPITQRYHRLIPGLWWKFCLFAQQPAFCTRVVLKIGKQWNTRLKTQNNQKNLRECGWNGPP